MVWAHLTKRLVIRSAWRSRVVRCPYKKPLQCYLMNDPRYEEIERSAVSPTLISLGIYDNDSAKAFVERLLPGERKLLYDIIGRKRAEQYHMTEANDTAEVHSEDLVKLWWVNSIPYCGYGFFDTSMMIVVGESVDRWVFYSKMGVILEVFRTIGLYVGISIMAAAAVGNIVSNLIGIGLVHYVEIFLLRYFNVRTPHLTVKQTNHWTVRYVSNCAKITGLLIGCIIGMFPLLFYDAPARIHRCCVEAYETEAENSDLEIKGLSTPILLSKSMAFQKPKKRPNST